MGNAALDSLFGRTISRRPRFCRPRRGLCCALTFAAWAAFASPAQAGPNDAPLEYQVRIADPASRYVEVQIEVPPLPGKHSDFAMPAWAPGSYLVRDFGRHVYEVNAGAAKGPMKVIKRDKQTWRVVHGGKAFTLRYRVYADELSVRTSYVDDRMSLLNGTSVFMYLVGDTARPAQLRVAERPAGWKVFTSLRSASPGRYQAESYDALVDAPLLMGEATRVEFKVAGAEIEYVFVAPSGSNADVARLADDTRRVVEAFAKIMGGLPFSHYSFLMIADPAGGGGLEHTHSTAMIMPPYVFGDEAMYERAARLAAHEFFHAWNVKRIHDRVLGPFDYSKENYSSLLWFHEGFTETMEARAVLAAGIIDNEAYLAGLAKSWGRYSSRPGGDHTPISQLSRDAWIKAYKPAPNHRNTAISYYLKGDLIGVLLDLELRRRSRTHGTQGSIEGLFRRLWSQRDPKSGDLAITASDITAAASAEAGEDMSDFFERYVDGTQPLPLPQALAAAGIESFGLKRGETPPPAPGAEPPAKTDAAAPAAPAKPLGWIGARGGDDKITAIDRDSPAQRAGLAVGDELVALDGARVTSFEALNARVEGAPIGSRLRVDFFRRGRLDRRVITVAESPVRDWIFRALPLEKLEASVRAVRESWLPEASDATPTGSPAKTSPRLP